MPETVIAAEQLSKVYRLGRAAARADSFVGALAALAAAPLRNLRELRRLDTSGRAGAPSSDEADLWALRDVSFGIGRGEVVGVIGRNGAGKSTLLKVLSRVAEPTAGRVRLRGRIAALLEVGTGFHMELTGRENIYLNGTILGMTKREIDRKFDEIVEFSGVERFLDTPVKRYSSGMRVRLGFAVAANLDPDILIVDEVLAVGDAEFQRKCLGKMQEISEESGRTILFVSHNHGALEALCTRGLLMSGGRLAEDGPIGQVIGSYLRGIEDRAAGSAVSERTDRAGAGRFRFRSVAAFSTSGPDRRSAMATGRPARFQFELDRPAERAACNFTIYNQRGHAVAHFATGTPGPEDEPAPPGSATSRFVCEVAELPLAPGRYRINAALWALGDLQDHLEGAAFFDVEPGQVGGRPVAAHAHGDVHVGHRWVAEACSPAEGAMASSMAGGDHGA